MGKLVHNEEGWIYTGEFESDIIVGFGNLSLDKSGDSYLGHFKDYQKNGLGHYKWSDAEYIGFWKHNHKEGLGLFKSSTQHFFGNYRRDVPDGMGSCTWLHDGNTYEGEWQNGLRSGTGRFSWKTEKCVYEGHFKQNMMHGRGVIQYGDGSRYVGEFEFN